MLSRIICVGNGFLEEDSIGRRVYEHLVAGPLPDGVEVVDGGLAGLDLAMYLRGIRRAVFVDAVKGFGDDGHIIIMDKETVASYADGYGHSAGLPYLFHMADKIIEEDLPEMFLAGAENGSADAELMARVCLEVALNEQA